MRIVVIDDLPDVALMESIALQEHDVIAITSGFGELLTPAPWEGVDVAVVDWALGDEAVDGLRICAYLRENHPHIRRVLTTGRPDVAASAGAGLVADVILRKPYPAQTLREAVRAGRGAGIGD